MEAITFAKDLVDVLTYISEKLGVAVDWGNDNLVPYLQELGTKIVTYKESIAWLWVSLGAVILLVALVSFIMTLSNKVDSLWFSILCLVVGVAIIVINAYTIIGCKTFPEKVILDYIKQMQQYSR